MPSCRCSAGRVREARLAGTWVHCPALRQRASCAMKVVHSCRTYITNMKTIFAAMVLLAAFLVAPAIAHADCGDPDQPPCIGPVPTVDEVVAIMDRLIDPNVPSVEKSDIVTPPYDEHEARKLDVFCNYLRSERIWPINFTVTDIQPAPNNYAGATVSNPPSWSEHSGTGPVVLVLQNGHWFITHESASSRLDQLRNDHHTRVSPGLL
jgi:hypothetical protein